MLQDIWTMTRKELQELLEATSGMSGALRLLIWIGVIGIALPIQMGSSWIDSPSMLFSWTWFPMFIVSSVIASAFAGERERHTLETLLASRLSDQAILYGKIAACIIYGWGISLASMLLGLITYNIAFWQGSLTLYPALYFWGGILLSLLSALLVSGAGVLVSLRAKTTRQAQQIVSLVMLLVFLVPTYGIQALPADLQTQLMQIAMSGVTFSNLALVAAALSVISAGLLLAAQARFQRHKLIL